MLGNNFSPNNKKHLSSPIVCVLGMLEGSGAGSVNGNSQAVSQSYFCLVGPPAARHSPQRVHPWPSSASSLAPRCWLLAEALHSGLSTGLLEDPDNIARAATDRQCLETKALADTHQHFAHSSAPVSRKKAKHKVWEPGRCITGGHRGAWPLWAPLELEWAQRPGRRGSRG